MAITNEEVQRLNFGALQTSKVKNINRIWKKSPQKGRKLRKKAGMCVVPEAKRRKYFKKEWSILSNAGPIR